LIFIDAFDGILTNNTQAGKFLEIDLPLAVILFVLLSRFFIVVYALDPKLALAGDGEVATMLVIYSLPHDRFLNAQLPI
jgi:hypothetical protein